MKDKLAHRTSSTTRQLSIILSGGGCLVKKKRDVSGTVFLMKL